MNDQPTPFDQILAAIQDRFDPSEEFFVERAFINARFERTAKVNISTASGPYIRLMFRQPRTIFLLLDAKPIDVDTGKSNDDDALNFVYFDRDETNQCHGLMIFDADGNAIYEREAYHNPKTAWSINALANNSITDDTGKMLFEGEPINI